MYAIRSYYVLGEVAVGQLLVVLAADDDRLGGDVLGGHEVEGKVGERRLSSYNFV